MDRHVPEGVVSDGTEYMNCDRMDAAISGRGMRIWQQLYVSQDTKLYYCGRVYIK